MDLAAAPAELAPACWTPAALLGALAARGDQPALLTIVGDEAIPFAAATLADAAHRLASGLIAAGIGPGTPVGLYAPSGPAWVVARLGIGAAGALPVAVDDLVPEDEAAVVLRAAGCDLVLTSEAHAAALPLECGRVITPGADGTWQQMRAAPGPLPAAAPDAAAMLVTTSGTTGAPKLFVLTHANLHANVAGILNYGLLDAADRVLLPLPLHHVYPLLVGLLAPLAAGATVVFPQGVGGPQILAALRAGRATALIGVPRLYTALLAGVETRVAARGATARRIFGALLRLSLALRRRGIHAGKRLFRPLHAQFGPELRYLVSGGARLDTEASWRLEALGWRLLNGYGLAETASLFTGNVPDRQRIGSEGQPIAAGSEVRIADPESLDRLPAGSQGEIQLRGANVFAGYRDNTAANESAFTPDGWFRSGDLGHLDADGFLHVTGRLKELIVLGGGKNVFPDQLEAVYGASPMVKEIAVLERAGALVAVVLPDLEAARAAGNRRVDDAVRVALAEAGQGLPPYQRLAGFVLAREPLPRTRLGKYPRFRLPALYEALKSGAAAAPTAAPLTPEDEDLLRRPGAAETWALLRARFPDRDIALDAHPQLDLGLDSLEWVSLAVELESRTGVRLTEAETADFASVREILLRVAGGPGATTQAAPMPQAEIERWIAPPSAGLAPVRAAGWLGVQALARTLFRLRVEGAGHVPAEGPFVVVANHVSDLDPGLVGAALPGGARRRVWWGGDRGRLFDGRVRPALARAFRVFPVDERSPGATIAMARSILARGDALVWFPESWRSPDGSLQRFLPGIGLVLDGLDLPVVPALIQGAFEAMPRNRRLPRPHPIRVTFGPPVPSASLPAGAAEKADRLRELVGGLAGGG